MSFASTIANRAVLSATATRAQVKSSNRRSLIVKAEGEVAETEKPAAPAKVARNTDDLAPLYMLGVSDQSLSYLDGSLPGDYGFDPLGLSDPEGAGGFINPAWLAYAEVIHGRWAMLGVAGATAPETMKGFIPDSTAVVWFKNGIIPAQGSYDFWAPPTALFWVMVCLMNFVEINRLTEYANPGFRTKQSLAGLEKGMGGTGNPAYPGGSFNPMGMGKNDMETMKVKEIKNGRLAMMAFFGIMVQAIITGEGPVKNLTDHVTDPFGHNLLTNFANVGGVSPF
jgi:light-harvesting complex I chlorophyll a/b binding protein 3